MYGVAVAGMLTIGGAMLAYVARESVAPGEGFDWAAHGWLGPLTGGITLLDVGEWTGTAWHFMGWAVGSGLIATVVGWQRSRTVVTAGKSSSF
jgi:hypothetical protein